MTKRKPWTWEDYQFRNEVRSWRGRRDREVREADHAGIAFVLLLLALILLYLLLSIPYQEATILCFL